MKRLIGWFGALTMMVAGCAGSDSGAVTYAWCEIDSPDFRELRAVSFADAEVGTVVGGIHRTTDGGRTWTTERGPLGDLLYSDVVFTDESTGTIVGEEGAIVRTIDGGQTWLPQDSGTSITLRGVSFSDHENGIAVGDGGTILRTTDGGATWTREESGTDARLNGAWSIDEETATVVGDDGTIVRTTDGGATWMLGKSGTNTPLAAVSFASDHTGVTVGAGGLILRTVDGGATWTRLEGYGTDALNDVWFADGNVGTIVGDAGTFLRTTDAGATWAYEPTDASYLSLATLDSEPVRLFNDFYGVSMPDAENGVAVGQLGDATQRAALRDAYGTCDSICAKTIECYPQDALDCNVSCLCDLRYANRINPECEREYASWLECVFALTCEQIDDLFSDPEAEQCAAEEMRAEEACADE